MIEVENALTPITEQSQQTTPKKSTIRCVLVQMSSAGDLKRQNLHLMNILKTFDLKFCSCDHQNFAKLHMCAHVSLWLHSFIVSQCSFNFNHSQMCLFSTGQERGEQKLKKNTKRNWQKGEKNITEKPRKPPCNQMFADHPPRIAARHLNTSK